MGRGPVRPTRRRLRKQPGTSCPGWNRHRLGRVGLWRPPYDRAEGWRPDLWMGHRGNCRRWHHRAAKFSGVRSQWVLLGERGRVLKLRDDVGWRFLGMGRQRLGDAWPRGYRVPAHASSGPIGRDPAPLDTGRYPASENAPPYSGCPAPPASTLKSARLPGSRAKQVLHWLTAKRRFSCTVSLLPGLCRRP